MFAAYTGPVAVVVGRQRKGRSCLGALLFIQLRDGSEFNTGIDPSQMIFLRQQFSEWLNIACHGTKFI